MSKIRGNDIIFFVKVNGNWMTLAYGTSCELDVNVTTLAKSPEGRCERYLVKRFSWGGSSSHLQSDVISGVDVFDLLRQATEQRVLFGSIEMSSLPRDFAQYLPDGRFGLKGNAHINRMTVTGHKDSKTSLSISFTGTGPLESIFEGVLFVPADAEEGMELADGRLLEVYTINTD